MRTPAEQTKLSKLLCAQPWSNRELLTVIRLHGFHRTFDLLSTDVQEAFDVENPVRKYSKSPTSDRDLRSNRPATASATVRLLIQHESKQLHPTWSPKISLSQGMLEERIRLAAHCGACVECPCSVMDGPFSALGHSKGVLNYLMDHLRSKEFPSRWKEIIANIGLTVPKTFQVPHAGPPIPASGL